MLAGCSNIPSAYNPVDWAQSGVDEVSSWFASKPAPAGVNVEPPPAEGRPYPNLAQVPKPPPRVTPEVRAQREREIASLQASRQSALAADASLRTTGAVAGTSPPIAAIPPAPTAIPAASVVTPPTVATAAPDLRPSLPPRTAPPAPVVPAAMAPAMKAPTVAQRVGSVAFARNATALSANSQGVLQDAARSAAGTGVVRLMPAQISREAAVPQLVQGRAQAIAEVLRRAGLPADRIALASDMGLRVDVYDVYVER